MSRLSTPVNHISPPITKGRRRRCPPDCRIAVVGAGPVGLALALHAARLLPGAQITLFDARPAERDISADPRTLALALGSVQFLQRLGCWNDATAQAIHEVHVSQQPPSLGDAGLRLRAADMGATRRRDHAPGHVAAGVHAAPGSPGAQWPGRPSAIPSDPTTVSGPATRDGDGSENRTMAAAVDRINEDRTPTQRPFPPLFVHDLRRTFSSRLNDALFPEAVVEASSAPGEGPGRRRLQPCALVRAEAGAHASSRREGSCPRREGPSRWPT